MTVKQLSIFLENRSGTMTKVLDILKETGVRIIASSIADTAEYGLFRVICTNPQKAYEELAEAGVAVALSDVFAIQLDNRPGQVADMLTATKQVYKQSAGALDLTVYPLLKLWGFIDGKYYVPYDSEILDQLSRVCFDKVILTSFPSSGTYTVSMPAYGEMSFGAVAKGCAADKAIAAMRAAGVTSGIISLGGNVQTLGLKPDGTQWRVGIEDPNNPGNSYVGVLNVGETAVVTSGSYQRNFTDVTTGNTYHHILKPQSGYPVSNNLVSVTIICKDGTMADCLSTAMFVLGEVQSLNYWRSYGKTDGGGFDMVLITKDNRIICTKGLIEDFTLVNEGYTLIYSE